MFAFDPLPLLLGALLTGVARQEAAPAPRLDHLWVLTADDASSGAVVAVQSRPWHVRTLAATDGALWLRRFGHALFAVNRATGRIRRVPIRGGSVQEYDVGPTSEPQDVLVRPLSPSAFVTRRYDPYLAELDLVTGAISDAVDLSPVGHGAPIALGTLERDGEHLFVQVRVEDVPGASGVLAVVDLAQTELLDLDPVAPGIQGIALQGAPPRGKMQILGRTLFVSATESSLDARGGIERVDLDLLVSTGFAITEEDGGSDMGGFAMIAPDEGYYVFHTDLLASTHLKHFTTANGPDPGPEIVVFLNDTVDVIAHDPRTRRILLPAGFSDPRGLYAVSTVTHEVVGPPLDIGRVQDVIVAR